jgi:hypothetical protein
VRLFGTVVCAEAEGLLALLREQLVGAGALSADEHSTPRS